MGRRERPLDPAAGPLYEFALALRTLRHEAGSPSYAHLARVTHYSAATLARAAAGQGLPTLDVTLAYVTACGADPAAWRERWKEIARQTGTAPDTPATPATPAPPARVTPMQLPPATPTFVGRNEELAMLDGLLASSDDPSCRPLAAIVGGPGTGKTQLAVRWARGVRDRFPDGVLFADLRGFDPGGTPVRADTQLEDFLRALGVPPAEVPFGVAARAALFRSVLDGRRVLLILDNAADTAQVRTLLPGAPHCLTLVTSRDDLAGLVIREGALRLRLPTLPDTDALELMRRNLPADHLEQAPDQVRRMVELCAGLPLALKIAAEHAAGSAPARLADLVAQLGEERHRLDVLAVDDDYSTMRAIFSWSYRSLDAPSRRVFRLLGADMGLGNTAPAVAAMAAGPPGAVTAPLRRLLGAHLTEQIAPGRYRSHDLLRLYAREQAGHEDDPAGTAAAVRRLLIWYLKAADAASRRLVPKRPLELDLPERWCVPPEFGDHASALAWFEAERTSLVAATRYAVATGEYDVGWRLPAALGGFFTLHRHWADWIETHTLGLEAARRLADRAAEALLSSRLGVAYGYLSRFEECSACFERALELHRETGDQPAEASTRLNFGFALWQMKRHEEAMAQFEGSLPIFRAIGDRHGEGMALNNLGEAHAELGRPDRALELVRESLAVFRDSGNRYGEGATLDSLGLTYLKLDRPDDALRAFSEARSVRAAIGDRHGEARTLRRIGDTLAQLGRTTEARERWLEALRLFESLDAPQAAEIRERVR